ncbi:hypothetical protein Mgra_00003441 [Meloidogyne graminicola]|uniref:Uncharacterized protein n=2 Tax=Meloidogyne graminicola TaxID=189291 RepID=A0A8S9ZUX2_9BILA|nr:hypothetical protein Mgra_00003441 [Meloidogyne graminicola]
MQLLILFLISIQFIFCSGVELLQNPGQLTEHEENTGKNIQPIEGLNKVVTDVMKLFVSAIRFVGMKDRKILKRLNNNYESIQEQYIYFSYLLGLLNNKLNLIIEHINTHPNTVVEVYKAI